MSKEEFNKALSYADHIAKDYFYKVIPGGDHIIREGEHAGAFDPTYEGFRAAAHEIVTRCSQTYDPKKANGATFMTYCRKPLQSGLQSYVRDAVQEIKINKDAQREAKRCRSLQRALAATEGKDPSYARLAKIMGISETRVGELLSVVNPFPTSLDAGTPVQGSSNVDGDGDDEESATPYSHDTVACTKYPNPEDHLLLKEKIIKRRTNDRGQTLDKKYNNFDVYGENWYEANYGLFNNKRGRENGPMPYHEEGSHGGNSCIHVYKNRREGISYKLFKTDKPFERRVVFYHNGRPFEEQYMGPGGDDVEYQAYDRMMHLVKMKREFGRVDDNGDLKFKHPDAKPLPSREVVENALKKCIFETLPDKDGIKVYRCRDHDFALIPGDKFADEPSWGSSAPKPNPKLLHFVIAEEGLCPTKSCAFSQIIGTVERSDLALLDCIDYLYRKTEMRPVAREEV